MYSRKKRAWASSKSSVCLPDVYKYVPCNIWEILFSKIIISYLSEFKIELGILFLFAACGSLFLALPLARFHTIDRNFALRELKEI